MSKSKLELRFAGLWRVYGGPTLKMEWPFAPPRKFRWDFCDPNTLVAVEIEGGIWTGGRHTRGSGFEKDCVKKNLAARDGWLVFYFTSGMLKKNYLETFGWIAEAIRRRKEAHEQRISVASSSGEEERSINEPRSCEQRKGSPGKPASNPRNPPGLQAAFGSRNLRIPDGASGQNQPKRRKNQEERIMPNEVGAEHRQNVPHGIRSEDDLVGFQRVPLGKESL